MIDNDFQFITSDLENPENYPERNEHENMLLQKIKILNIREESCSLSEVIISPPTVVNVKFKCHRFP